MGRVIVMERKPLQMIKNENEATKAHYGFFFSFSRAATPSSVAVAFTFLTAFFFKIQASGQTVSHKAASSLPLFYYFIS